jgi:hypothetical protein
MQPQTPGGQFLLVQPGHEYLLSTAGSTRVDLSSADGGFIVRWIDPRSGRMRPAENITAGKTVELTPPDAASTIVWLSRS